MADVNPERNQGIIELALRGFPQAEIAKRIKIARNVVIGVVDRARRRGIDIARQKPKRAGDPFALTRAEMARERKLEKSCDYDGPTTMDRLQALHNRMDAVLAQSRKR